MNNITYKNRKVLSDYNTKNLLLEKIEKDRIANAEKIGLLGMVFIQLAIIPNLIFGLVWVMHLSLLLGLCCYQYRNKALENIKLYTYSFYIGFITNALMLVKLWIT